jgi:hypothetical protein
MTEKRLPPGTLCKASFEGLTYTEDGFATVGTVGMGRHGKNSGVRLYSQIDVSSYPSCNDFKGETTIAYDNDVVVIVSYAGRPFNVKHDPDWFKYDIYEVLVRGAKRQMFRQNLSVILCPLDRR